MHNASALRHSHCHGANSYASALVERAYLCRYRARGLAPSIPLAGADVDERLLLAAPGLAASLPEACMARKYFKNHRMGHAR
jgi:hypothetical protein